jgi:hypothetical protein
VLENENNKLICFYYNIPQEILASCFRINNNFTLVEEKKNGHEYYDVNSGVFDFFKSSMIKNQNKFLFVWR